MSNAWLSSVRMVCRSSRKGPANGMSATMSRKLGSVPGMARLAVRIEQCFYTPSVVLGAPAIAIALFPRLLPLPHY